MSKRDEHVTALTAFLESPAAFGAVPLQWASNKKGWLVVQQNEDSFDVWTPADRPAAVPWAVPPCMRTLSRNDLVTFLQDNWL